MDRDINKYFSIATKKHGNFDEKGTKSDQKFTKANNKRTNREPIMDQKWKKMNLILKWTKIFQNSLKVHVKTKHPRSKNRFHE